MLDGDRTGAKCHMEDQQEYLPKLLNRVSNKVGMYSFCQLNTASMPTFIGRNITAYRPTHDCFYTNLDHIMTAYMPTLGLIA